MLSVIALSVIVVASISAHALVLVGPAPGAPEFDAIGGDGDGTVREGTRYTVTFDSRGGSDVESLTGLMEDQTISPPVPPVRDGYDFCGWYRDEGCTREWIFTYTIYKDMTLYAKWEPISDRSDGRLASFDDGGAEISVKILPRGAAGPLSGD